MKIILFGILFTNLGFQVVLSDHSSHSLFEKGMELIPSESVCYPAKMVHGHIKNLIEKGVTTIFYPCIMYEKKNLIKVIILITVQLLFLIQKQLN